MRPPHVLTFSPLLHARRQDHPGDLPAAAPHLLTIVPEHPWINFAVASMLFYVVSKELYRLTMSLR
jgi:hypothetical protein